MSFDLKETTKYHKAYLIPNLHCINGQCKYTSAIDFLKYE